MPNNGDIKTLSANPLIIALLSVACAFGGGWLKDRMAQSALESANSVRIEQLEKYKDDHMKVSVTRDDLNAVKEELKNTQRTYVTKDEFQQFSNTVLTELRDIKTELRETKSRR